ncbi:holliday junction DNA helicase RuvA [Candidatus Phytoplasma oryzae]|uniref:Holliday junction branch migration complex subunit RuvA n=1 Tax=Candidatus Phytoplasma oryzae TaxID=203274 RepID=A0A139JQX1_9MOLU|nr:Holliday junction branch migration protein RuvA [Candidatus Phytoplasma oryzae]KXT29387.1 holliday junction DNA helicase RuvA [Candidatus Phytoplasma oryzae]RAM57970.1 hypothetical protein DH96_00160 [Candidatus Phytoplasma oryzae]
MYHYFIGIITEIQKDHIILENNNIGYIIQFYHPHNIFVLNQKIKIFLYFYVRENINCLYGFINLDMLKLFKKLISIPSIGPKSAIMITNTDFVKQIKQTLKNNDLSELLKFPGIGKKTAQQILFHFRDNYFSLDEKNTSVSKKEDLKEALNNLGFLNKEIESITNKINFNQNLENIIKEALVFLTKK